MDDTKAEKTEKVLWSIGSAAGYSGELFDNYKDPNRLGDIVWDADLRASTEGGRQWPMFHPSEADPEAGYRHHPYTIRFSLDRVQEQAYMLKIDYLVIAPRLSYLDIRINGVTGQAHFRPGPSHTGEIVLLSGLHTTIYSEGTAEIVIPGSLLRQGANELVLTSRDGGDTDIVDRIEAVKRLDRMANGAGVIYRRLALSAGYPADREPASAVRSSLVQSTVLYGRREDGHLRNGCRLYVELNDAVPASEWTLRLRSAAGDAAESVRLAVPATAFGHLCLPFDVFDGEGEVAYTLEGAPAVISGTFQRRRKWKVYITPHAHTDIGYTHRQWEVAERLCRNIDTALDIIAGENRNAGRGPSDSPPSFTYHLDSGWALETYLQTRDGGRKLRLIDALKAGKISVAANYVDLLTQFAGLEDLIRNHEFLSDYLKPHGMQPTFAAVVDVASLTGSLPAVLEGSGIRYLVHANNQDRGPFRLNGGLHKLSPFYWEGTNGGRVLTWLAKMYCELRKVCGSPPLLSAAERGLDMWLQEYESPDYAPDAVLLYGQEADNTDLDPQPVDFVKRWNGTYEFPKLIACDVAEFFEYVEQEFGDRLKTVKGDGGAYWEDGAGSSIVPTIEARRTQAMLPAAERLESLAVLHHEGWDFPSRQFDEAWRDLLLYDEHTWGAFLSATEPEALLQRDQWAVKEGMGRSARQWADRLLHVAATRHSLSWNNDGREVVVYNPNSWPMSGPVRVEISPAEIVLDAETGHNVPLRPIRTMATQAVVELWVDGVPGFGYRRYVLASDKAVASAGSTPASHAGKATAEPLHGESCLLENDVYRLQIDVASGQVRSWYDKELGEELADAASPWGFGQLIYAEGGEGTRLVSNQADLPDGSPLLSADFRLKEAESESYTHGQTLRLKGTVPCGELLVEWTLPAGGKQVEVSYTLRKQERLAKEAVYIAFPCGMPSAEVLSDSQLGWVNWNVDQLPGGCKEWLPLQTGIIVQGERTGIHIASPDIPLFCIGDVVRGTWPKEKDLTGGAIYSYVLNNYWHTNYKGSQGGEIAFRYVLTSGERIAPEEAYRAGWQARQPLYAQRMSFQDFREVLPPYDKKHGGTLAEFESDGAAVTVIRKARHTGGFIVRMQEISGKPQTARFRIPGRRIARIWRTDLLEREQCEWMPEADGSMLVELTPWSLETIRLELEP
ncbi:hypothetical protein SD70_03250 [Gordoniibacillus kamchatkensis]|uniref:Alpha-mannosidase n=1 Tax=Gordoniibacillus kamchatkensis TaxID=1590651 RepID=A0ABR5AMJ9_9BACL|nr:glycosyl hydrolase-related protein [Paenibacillus sp. VKM B-2647]KIL42185.1 hypothetical protein SD70_03250 [Paenibacillus sp. VKM B-2647]